jgi:hypothetical protein
MKVKRSYQYLFASVFTGIILLHGASASAQDLLIFPKRIVFEGTNKRSDIINLTNNGRDTARYEISFVQIRMNEDGSFENIPDTVPGQSFAHKYLRYFPRKVILAPNESQTVKLQLTQTGMLLPGEYRSHLYFRSVPESVPLNGEKPVNDAEASGIAIRLTAVYGVTIPTIIRIGESSTQVSITNATFEMFDQVAPIVSMDFNRTGNMSTYGEIEVTHTSPDGRKTKVAEISGFAVYTPGTLRRARIDLKKTGVDYTSGTLTIVYSTSGIRGKRIKLADAHVNLK